MTLIEELKVVVGPSGWKDDPDALRSHLTEWRNAYRGKTALMVQPQTTGQVAEIVRLCANAHVSIVPQGGNTGLCAGAIPDESGEQILVSLSRMQAIRSISPENFSMVAEAGCVLANLQQAAIRADRYFPLSLAAEGSCQIGGNLSTNAGGTNVLHYGTAREQVLGLEVVLPDGRVWNGLRALRKDTAGYDLKQLYIGAEGTLGIITAANLKLYPVPKNLQTAFIGIDDVQTAVDLMARLRDEMGDQLQAFELLPARAMRFVQTHMPTHRAPFPEEYPWYVLLESSAIAGTDAFEDTLMKIMEQQLVIDVVVAKNKGEADDFWRTRHAISEAQKLEGASLKHDVSVPVSAIAKFVAAAEEAVTAYIPDVRVVAFGHVGDGNVHFNLSQPRDWPPERFLAERDELATRVYDTVAKFDGSISAEHGIGVAKRAHLVQYRSTTELSVMRALKAALDPDNIMNPGKVV